MSDERMVYGWMAECERMALRRWAFGLDVLEVGPYEGLSTLQLASTGKSVHSVDTFDGRATPEPRDTHEAFVLNMRAAGFTDKVTAFKGESAHVLRHLDPAYDLAFIDAAHDFGSVMVDASLARKLLRPGGAMAFHDHDAEHPGVVDAVGILLDNGMHLVEQVNSLVLLREGPAPERKKIRVAIAMPHRDGWVHMGASLGAASWPSTRYSYQLYNRGRSVLTQGFNELWCDALNDRDVEGFTHFAMLHNDVIPQRGWLDVLIEELETRRLDCLSAVVPIKDRHGLTSTGLDTPGNPWGVRRLTMTEVMALPETFTAEDVPGRVPDQGLVLNTGCWVMRFDRPWVRGLCFRQQDRIVQLPDGKYAAESISEDWDWSRQLLSRGCRLGATRRVSLYHQFPQYTNGIAWGEWTRDEDFFREQDARTAAVEPAELTAAE